MKEYKLSAKSKFSVCYFLCGLFMFFFMFAILNLSSYAKTTSFNLKTASPRPTSFDGSCTVSFGTPSFTVNIPQDSGVQSSYSKTFYYTTNLYVTTTAGTFLLRTDNYNFTATVYPNQGNTFSSDLHMTGIGSFELAGQFISADLVLDSDDVIDYFTFNGSEYGTLTSGIYQTYRGDLYGGMRSEIRGFGISSVNSNFVSVSNSSSNSSSFDLFNFSDYSSFSPLNTSSVVKSKPNFGGKFYPAGSTINYTFLDVTQPSQGVFESYICFSDYGSGDYIFYYSILSTSSSLDLEHIYLGLVCDGVNYTFSQNQFSLVSSTHLDSTTYQYTYSVSVSVPYKDGIRNCFLLPYFPYSGVTGISFSGYKIKGTISDYMEFVKNNYDTINPSVIDTNTNTSQTVTDIGTVKLSEGQVFTGFDSLTSTSGFDSFSLTSVTSVASAMNFLSTCIVTVFNGLPSGFRWLIQAIGCIGIISLLLNVFGRVGQRMHMDRVESERLSILRNKHSGGT